MDQILKRLDDLHMLIESQGVNNKEVLNMNEACKYLELSISHLYKLTSAGTIPFYKPTGKKLYFKKSELDSWLLRNRCATQEEIENDTSNYLKRGRR